MLPCQSQFFLLHVEGNRFGDFYFVGSSTYCDRSVFFYSGKRIQVSFQTMFRQFLSDDRVVIQKMKASSGVWFWVMRNLASM